LSVATSSRFNQKPPIATIVATLTGARRFESIFLVLDEGRSEDRVDDMLQPALIEELESTEIDVDGLFQPSIH
jgi:hypothetical protein